MQKRGGSGPRSAAQEGVLVVVAVSIYTIVDLEFPRLGLIRIDVADQLLVRLLSTMS